MQPLPEARLFRAPGWEARLAVFLHERRSLPFAWGPHDCASFAIESVRVVTLFTVWPVTWTTARAATQVIAAAGGLEAATSSRLGPASPNWHRLRRGDIALVETAGRPSLSVCTGQSLAGPGLDRLEHLPLTAAKACWRVG